MSGDRVEVRWQAGLFDAAVTKVHASGSVDVKYDSDGSAGISLTAEAHGLTLLGDEEKKGGGGKKKKVCLVDGCPNREGKREAWQQTLLGRWLLHQGARTGVVLQSRRIRSMSSRRLHHPRGEERSLVLQAHGEAVLHRSRLRHPANPWQFVCFKHDAYGYCTLDACISNAISISGFQRRSQELLESVSKGTICRPARSPEPRCRHGEQPWEVSCGLQLS